ncbi:MAG: DUF1329 domain-containing protein [Myxococcota bacterium]
MPPEMRIPASLLLALLLAALPSGAGPPEEGECPTVSAIPTGAPQGTDARPIALKEGMVLRQQDLLALQSLLPREIWQHREAFFYEGMRLEIGACHRRYAVPRFYREATERFAGQAQLDERGNLRNYRAGLPFPPEQIDPTAPDAGARWAWNLEHRYRGAGHAGSFRLVDFPSRLGGIQVYTGDFFWLQIGHRSDLAGAQYQLPMGDGRLWAAGGRFATPFDARHLAWRQFRGAKSLVRHQEPDDTFVYVPTMRKMRRAATSWIDGMFLPRYSVTGESGGGGLPFGAGPGGSAGSINPTAGRSIAVSEHLRRGFTGLTLRPNAYIWRVRGERNVIAPLNASSGGYPEWPERNFGHSGLSMASDRWDVRYAVVIEGRLLVPEQEVRSLIVYIDYQTQQPLFWITRTDGRRLFDIGVLVHRFSGDVAGYPEWPGGTPALVFEPVAAAFFNALERAGGWRRESYDIRSLPFSEEKRRRMTSSVFLARGH